MEYSKTVMISNVPIFLGHFWPLLKKAKKIGGGLGKLEAKISLSLKQTSNSI